MKAPAALITASFDQLDLTRSPGLVEPGLGRAVEAEDRVPTLARNSLNPVALFAFRVRSFRLSRLSLSTILAAFLAVIAMVVATVLAVIAVIFAIVLAIVCAAYRGNTGSEKKACRQGGQRSEGNTL